MMINVDDVIAVHFDPDLWVVDYIEDLGDSRFRYHCSMLDDDVRLGTFVSEEIEYVYLPLVDGSSVSGDVPLDEENS